MAKTIAALLMALTLTLAGCGRRPPNATPDGAVRELVERLRHVHGDAADARSAYELLSKRTQSNLSARAQRYSAASGKMIAPEAMLAPSRFLVRFEPQRYVAKIAGAHALVDVTGLLEGDHAQIACVFEDDVWRVELALPPLAPVQLRPGSGT
jgi:predicted small lipoprotein YifL